MNPSPIRMHPRPSDEDHPGLPPCPTTVRSRSLKPDSCRSRSSSHGSLMAATCGMWTALLCEPPDPALHLRTTQCLPGKAATASSSRRLCPAPQPVTVASPPPWAACLCSTSEDDVHHLADPSGRVQHSGRLQRAVVDADEQGPLVANPCPTAIFPVQRIQRNTVPSSSLCGCDAI